MPGPKKTADTEIGRALPRDLAVRVLQPTSDQPLTHVKKSFSDHPTLSSD